MTSADFVFMKQELLNICESESQRERVNAWLCRYLRMATVQKEIPRREFLFGNPKLTANVYKQQMLRELLEADSISFDIHHLPFRTRFTMRIFAICKPLVRKLNDVA